MLSIVQLAYRRGGGPVKCAIAFVSVKRPRAGGMRGSSNGVTPLFMLNGRGGAELGVGGTVVGDGPHGILATGKKQLVETDHAG